MIFFFSVLRIELGALLLLVGASHAASPFVHIFVFVIFVLVWLILPRAGLELEILLPLPPE
jgi:hypothetical protein